MLLAAIYPLSEKSALNLSAKVSVNLTYYEEENMFNVNTGQVSSAGEIICDFIAILSKFDFMTYRIKLILP